MTLITRLRDAARVLRHGSEEKASSLFQFGALGATGASKIKWGLGNYEERVKEGYALNSLIFAPIQYKARAVSSVPIIAERGERDNSERLDADHPLSMLLAHPNPIQTWRDYTHLRKIYLELAGNSYVLAERERGGQIVALHNLRPDRVRIIPEGMGVRGYIYIPPGKRNESEGIPLLAEDVAHVKYPNPLDELEGYGYGLPPLLAAARDADTDNAITSFIKILFERGAMPMGMLRFTGSLTPEAAAQMKQRFMDKYGSFNKWVEPIVMDENGSYERIGMTFQELGFDVLDARNEARILSVFGVPAILIGTRYGLAHGTYSNYMEARTQFWQDILVPELRMFEDADRRLLNSEEEETFVSYDLAQVPALQADTTKLVDSAHKLWSMGVPRAQAFAAVGLKVEETEGDDVSYVSTSVAPAGSAQQEQGVTVTTPKLVPKPNAQLTDETEAQQVEAAARRLARPK